MAAPHIDQPAFGARLRQLRMRRRLSQRDVAGGLVNPSYISLIESGARVPTLDVATHLAENLGVPLEELLAGASGAPDGRHDRADDTASQPRPHAPIPSSLEATDRLVRELLADGAREAGDLADAQVRFRSAYEGSQAAGNTFTAIENGWALLDILGRLSDVTGRLDLTAALVDLAEELGNVDISVRSWIDRAAALRDAGDLRAAKDIIGLARAEVDRSAMAHTGEHVRLLGVAISISAELGEFAELGPMITAMLDVAGKVNSDAVLGRALWVAGLGYGQMGDPDAASSSMSAAARILSSPSTSLRDWIRFSLAGATALLDCHGDRETVHRHLRTARTALSLVDLPAEAAAVRLQEARAAVRDAEHDRALADLDRLESSTDDLAPSDQAMYWSVRARALEGLGRIDDAVAALRRAVELAESLGAYRIAAGHWREIDRLRSR